MGNLVKEIKNPKRYIKNCKENSSFGVENITIEHRSYNTKRDYLFVNRKQCKHIPSSPTEMLNMCRKLADLITKEIPNVSNNENVLVIGFAETATAIAKIVAGMIQAKVMCTTREELGDNVDKEILAVFEEEHSHAVDQVLLCNKSDAEKIQYFSYILFIDDEVTTGNTIGNLINQLSKNYKLPDRMGVASICNWMTEEAKKNMCEKFQCYDFISLVSGELVDRNMKIDEVMDTSNVRFATSCDFYNKKDVANVNYQYINLQTNQSLFNSERLGGDAIDCSEIKNRDKVNYGNIISNYDEIDLSRLVKIINNKIHQYDNDSKLGPVKSIRIVGTEEFMALPIIIGKYLEDQGYDVICHSTTRSPIDKVVSKKMRDFSISTDSGIVSKYYFPSAYDEIRGTYLYNLNEHVDIVLVITDVEIKDWLRRKYANRLCVSSERIVFYSITSDKDALVRRKRTPVVKSEEKEKESVEQEEQE